MAIITMHLHLRSLNLATLFFLLPLAIWSSRSWTMAWAARLEMGLSSTCSPSDDDDEEMLSRQLQQHRDPRFTRREMLGSLWSLLLVWHVSPMDLAWHLGGCVGVCLYVHSAQTPFIYVCTIGKLGMVFWLPLTWPWIMCSFQLSKLQRKKGRGTEGT